MKFQKNKVEQEPISGLKIMILYIFRKLLRSCHFNYRIKQTIIHFTGIPSK